MRNEQKKLVLAMQLSDKDPQLAHTEPGTDSRHHAIPNAPSQLQSEETGTPAGRKSAKGIDKKPKINPAARQSTGTRRKAIASPKDDPPAATASKRSNNQHADHDANDNSAKIQNQSTPSNNGTKLRRLKLTMPATTKGRPRTQRSSRQKYTLHLTTEVDWNEDLRPTDDESEHLTTTGNDKEGDTGVGTSVSTPDPKLTSDGEHAIKPEQKRKLSKTQPSSEKRRKVSSTKSSSGTTNKRQPQLPLTAAPTGRSKASASRASNPNPHNLRSNARNSHGQLTGAHTRDTSTGPPSGQNTPKLKDTASQQKEIILISSSPAPSSSSIPGTGIDVLQNQAYRYRAIGTGITGRGKAIGQKLRDALQGVELHTQLRPAIETSLQSADEGLDGMGNERVPSPPSRMHSPTESQNENSQTHPTLQQDQEDVTMAEDQPQPEPLPIQDAESQEEIVHQDGPDNEKIMEYPWGLREESSSPEASIPREYSTDETRDESETRSSHAVNLEPFNAADAPEHFQASIPFPQSPIDYESDTSSQDSLEAETNRFANGYPPKEQNKDNQTPDSGQPLLTRRAALQRPSGASRPAITTFRSSIVDANGSPRLFEEASLVLDQTESPLKEVQIPSEPEIPQSSPISYDQISDEFSLHRSDDETWSKYQRDMFLQYGFSTESMDTRPQSALPGHSFAEEESEITTSRRIPRQHDPSLSYNPHVGPSSIATGLGTRRATLRRNSATGPHEVAPLSTQAQEVSRVQQSSQSDQTHPPDWILTLQNAQRSAHNLLQETNQVSPADPSPIDYQVHELIFGQTLSSQLAAEQEMIQQVLQIYRQGCNRILEELSEAHRVRTNLYQQQMASVRNQHHAICQDLIRGFQELDDRFQEGP